MKGISYKLVVQSYLQHFGGKLLSLTLIEST